MSICVAILLGMSVLAGIFLGVSFQNIAFCKVFCNVFMKKCYTFTICTGKFLVSIKAKYKLNSFVAYFCQHQWLQGGGRGAGNL